VEEAERRLDHGQVEPVPGRRGAQLLGRVVRRLEGERAPAAELAEAARGSSARAARRPEPCVILGCPMTALRPP
jgi:hypothetical protein